jgi:hypothetical protein
MDHGTKIQNARLTHVTPEPSALLKMQQSAEPQPGSVALPAHVPPQVLRKLVGRAPNRALQRLVGENGGPVPDQAEQTIQRETGHGQSLTSSTQAQMGSALGTDLAGVRVHNDDTSDQLAGQLGARAFTVDSDIFFAANEYQPATSDGQRVIAHELAHVMQDSAEPKAKLTVGSVDDPAEAQADAVAQRVVETIHQQTASPEEDPARELRRQPEEEEEDVQELRRQPEEEEEEVQALRRQENPEEEEVQTLRRQENPEEEEVLTLRRQPEEEEEKALTLRRASPEEEEAQPLHRKQLIGGV